MTAHRPTKTYRVTWPTRKGPLAVVVEATVQTDLRAADVGLVSVECVRLDTGEGDDRPRGARIEPEDFVAAERSALYEELRKAAELCPACCGARKVTYRGSKNGRSYRRKANCVACLGTGRVLEAGSACPRHPRAGVRRDESGGAEVCRAFGCEWRHVLEVRA